VDLEGQLEKIMICEALEYFLEHISPEDKNIVLGVANDSCWKDELRAGMVMIIYRVMRGWDMTKVSTGLFYAAKFFLPTTFF